MSQVDLSIIIVNWNTADLLKNCLESIYQHVSLEKEVIVVDNNSTDNSVDMVRTSFPQVQLIAESENLGFPKGNNVGLELAHGRYILLLNPDTEVYAEGLEPLIQFMDENPAIGIAGPTLWNPDGTHQPSQAPFPTLWIEFLRQTMLYRVVPNEKQKRAHKNIQQQAEMVTGAALCIRRSCYEQIGPLDPQIFMFYEDTDWCKRAHDHGWEIWYLPTAGIMHVKAAASSRFARTRTLLDSQRSTIYYFQKHYGSSAVWGLRGITLCGSVLRAIKSLIQWVLNQNRPDQAARLQAYRKMFQWGLTGKGL